MTQRNRILKALSVLLPAGALGASVALASTAAQATAVSNQSTAPQSVAGAGVSARLEAIRSGVSAISGHVNFFGDFFASACKNKP